MKRLSFALAMLGISAASVQTQSFNETASGIDSTGKRAVADRCNSADSANNHQLAGIFGITHKF